MDLEKISEGFNEVAEMYDSQRKYFIPCFDDYYGFSMDFIKKLRNSFKSVLDLGAGTGLLTKYLYDMYPEADFTLADISEQMLDAARMRFKGLNNFEFIVTDYSKELPMKQFELIASALSIHHLEDSSKAALYSNIYDNLAEGGCFINLDQFNAESSLMNKKYNDYWYDFINKSPITEIEKESWLKRRELDRENTIDQTKILLKQAGFGVVECIYSYMKFGVVLAVK